jgi:hypothetical protein
MTKEINAALKISPLLAHATQVPPWRWLIEIWDLDTDTLRNETERALSQFERLEVRDPGELLHLAGIMLWRQSMGDLTLSAGEEPLRFVRAYLDRLHSTGAALDVDFELFTHGRMAAYGYAALHAEESDEELRRIARLIQGSMKRSAESKFPTIRESLSQKLTENGRDLQKISHGSGELSKYLEMPVFARL